MRLSKIIENIDLQGVYCYDNIEVGQKHSCKSARHKPSA